VTQRADQQSAMETKICAVYDEHKGRHGYRRITATLCHSMNELVNHKGVRRLMQKMRLRALIRAKKWSRYVTGLTAVHLLNGLQRDF
jgi:putative transposase